MTTDSLVAFILASPPTPFTVYSPAMRAIIVFAVSLVFSLSGLGEISGTVGFRADGRGATGLSGAAILNVDFPLEPLMVGANLSLPLPGLDWTLTLRGSVEWDPLRLSLQGGFSPRGLVSIRQGVRFSPQPWDLPAGEARVSAQLDLYIQDPLDTPSPTLTGSAAGYVSWEDLWLETTVGAALYPFPPRLGRKGLAFGYQLYPFWITLRSYFLVGWDYSIAEFGYQEAPLRATVQVTFGPEGLQRASLFLSCNPDPFRFSLNAAATSQGPSPISLAFGFDEERAESYLRATIAFPFRLQAVGAEVRVRF